MKSESFHSTYLKMKIAEAEIAAKLGIRLSTVKQYHAITATQNRRSATAIFIDDIEDEDFKIELLMQKIGYET